MIYHIRTTDMGIKQDSMGNVVEIWPKEECIENGRKRDWGEEGIKQKSKNAKMSEGEKSHADQVYKNDWGKCRNWRQKKKEKKTVVAGKKTKPLNSARARRRIVYGQSGMF